MSHDIRVVTPDGSVLVTATPEKFKIGSQYGETEVCLSWDRADLGDDPEGRAALKNAWVGRDSITLTTEGGDVPVFDGKIVCLGWTEDSFVVEALETAETPSDPIEIRAMVDSTSPNKDRVMVTVENHGEGDVSIDFGDGSETVNNVGDGMTVSAHSYDASGNYVIVATDTDMPERTAQYVVHIAGSAGALGLTVTADDTDPAKLRVKVTVDNSGEGAVDIDFGDGTATVTNAGDGEAETLHDYEDDGTYTVTATDTDRPQRTGTQEVTVEGTGGPGEPAGDLTVTILPDDSDPNRKTASLTADNKGQGAVTVVWGDGSTSESYPGDNSVRTHAYTGDGTFSVTVTDEDDPSRMVDTLITLPFDTSGS